MLETLESRRLLAATLSNGTLTIIGTNRSDRIEVISRLDDGQVRVELNGTETRFRFGDINRIHISGGRGNDFIEFSGRDGGIFFPSNVSGGKGNDVIGTGLGDDTISGGTGHDRIEGDAGEDLIVGGNGNDVIRGGHGHDTLRGDAGNDYVSGDRHRDYITGGAGDDDLRGGRDIDTVFGNAGNDDYATDPVLEIKDRKQEDEPDNVER